MSSLYYYMLFCILLCLTTIECKPLHFDYIHYPGMDGELKFHNFPTTWLDAKDICFKEGAILASPTNETMKNALDFEMERAAAVGGIYTGVVQYTKEYFYSLEGVPLDDMPVQWLPGQPDNAGSHEDCIAYRNGRVADVNCSEPLPFVCYRNVEFIHKNNCPEGYKYVALYNKCYKLHHDSSASVIWTEADEDCKRQGGQLANFPRSASNWVSEAVPWSHILNLVSDVDFHKGEEMIIFVSNTDDNGLDWISDSRSSRNNVFNVGEGLLLLPDTLNPCTAIYIHHGIRTVKYECARLAVNYLCEKSTI